MCGRPGAVADEDTLSDGECAVVPHQQEVKHGIQYSETKKAHKEVKHDQSHK